MSEGEPTGSKKLTRRDLMKLLLAGGAISAASTLPGCAPETPQPNRPNPSPEKAETSKEELVFDQRGIRVWIDAETKLPIRWQSPDNEGAFDKEKIIQIKEEATKNNEKRLVDVQRIQAFPHPWDLQRPEPQTEAKPLDLELPNDVLSNEELKEHGIEIINGNNVELFIREGAFDKGGVLEDFQKGSRHKLQIVLVDEAIVSPLALEDPQYKPLEHFVESQFGENTQYEYAGGRTPESMRKYLTEHLLKTIETSKGDDRIYYERIARITNTFTDKELVDWGMYPFYYGYTLPPEDKRSGGKHLVLVACGERKIRISTLDVTVDPSGNFTYDVIDYKAEELQGPDKLGLDQKQTKPSATDFVQNDEEFYTPKTPGFILEHELQHVNRNIANPNNPVAQDNEKAVDKAAYAEIQKAEQTGYYQFVLKRKDQPGYVFT